MEHVKRSNQNNYHSYKIQNVTGVIKSNHTSIKIREAVKVMQLEVTELDQRVSEDKKLAVDGKYYILIY